MEDGGAGGGVGVEGETGLGETRGLRRVEAEAEGWRGMGRKGVGVRVGERADRDGDEAGVEVEVDEEKIE